MGKSVDTESEKKEREFENEVLKEVVIKQLNQYNKNLENNKLIIQQLQKTIENNRKTNNQEMIKKLETLQKLLLGESNEDVDIFPLLKDVFKLESLSDKNMKLIEEQVHANINESEMDLSFDDLLNLMKYNDLL